MPRLDSTAAWTAARHMVAANRDMLAAIGGVFFLLPLLVLVLVLPKPEFSDGMDQQQMAQAFGQYYAAVGPWIILLWLPVLTGYLTLLVILLDRDRPSVGRAIVQAVQLLPTYLLVRLMVGFAMSTGWIIVAGLLSMAMPPIAAFAGSLVVMLYPMTRVMLIESEMVAFRLRNPLRAVQAGLARTRGQVTALLLFFGPAMALFFVVISIASMVVGLLIQAVLHALPNQQTVASATNVIDVTFVAAMFAVGYVYFSAMVAATWRQLGPIQGSDPDSPFAI